MNSQFAFKPRKGAESLMEKPNNYESLRLRSFNDPLRTVVEQTTYHFDHGEKFPEKNPVATGIDAIDEISRILWQSEITLITGAPGAGKSSLLYQMASHAGIQLQHDVAIFTLGETGGRVARSMVSGQANLNYDRLLSGDMDEDYWDRLTVTIGQFHISPISISEGRMDMNELHAIAVDWAERRPSKRCPVIFIDNFDQIVSAQSDVDRATSIGFAMKQMRELATVLKAPVVIVSPYGVCPDGQANVACPGRELECAIYSAYAHSRIHIERAAAPNESGRSRTISLSGAGNAVQVKLCYLDEIRKFTCL